MQKPEHCALVIFGASGDLTKRKLVPGLYNLHKRKLLPGGFAVLGIGRTPMEDASFRNRMVEALEINGDAQSAGAGDRELFAKGLYYQSVDTKNAEHYRKIREKLAAIDAERDTRGNHLFYMATPPSLFEPIVRNLGSQNLQQEETGYRRLIVEKPFGYDLGTARRLNASLHDVFEERQIYRIDHYLGKETVQNMLVLRFGNGIYEPLWNRNYVDRVEITAAEQIGVEGRGGYYEGAGALRDMFQNHLMNVVAMIAMEPPSTFNADSVRNETIKVFDSIRSMQPEEVSRYVIRGQYTDATVRGQRLPGYRAEEGVADDSKTETYVAVKFYIDNWRWAGVPFFVRTGKRLPTRITEAVIHFKQPPHRLFGRRDEACYDCNQMILRIQPDEGILMKFNLKLPGSGFEVKTVNMDFHYSELSDVYSPEAYERLLLDSMIGDATLYARSDAVEACWRFVDPILEAWKSIPETKLFGYPSETWGPLEARDLLDHPELDWRYPCRNLADGGEFCEL